MSQYLTVILIGLSFNNFWICSLLTFSLQNIKKNIAYGYILGRLIIIFLWGLIISILGKLIPLNYFILKSLTGGFIVIFSFYLLLSYLLKPMKKNIKIECDNNCNNCTVKELHEYKKYCNECYENQKNCLAENSEIKGLYNKNFLYSTFGIIFGILKGTIFCSKFLLISPILFNTSVLKSIILTFLFGTSSSIYPFLALILGKIILKIVKYRKFLLSLNIIFIFLIGIKFIIDGIISVLN